MDNKNIVAGIAGVAVVGILSYLGYRVMKQLNDFDLDWENLDDAYYHRIAKNQ